MSGVRRVAARVHREGALASGDEVELGEDQTHHLRHVLRLQPDEVVGVFNAGAGEFAATIQAYGKRAARLAVGPRLRAPGAEPDLWLCRESVQRKMRFESTIRTTFVTST